MVSMEDVVDMGVLRWSEIETEEERQQFANFFIQSDVKFTRMRNGMYEAIVRMVPPGIDREVRVCLSYSFVLARARTALLLLARALAPVHVRPTRCSSPPSLTFSSTSHPSRAARAVCRAAAHRSRRLAPIGAGAIVRLPEV